MSGADAGTGQHGDRQLRRHAHVDSDTVALSDAEELQDIRELLYVPMQLLVGQCPDFAGLALPDDGGFILARGCDVPIETVVRKIELASDEPLRPGAIPFEDFVPLLEPVQLTGDESPEFFGIINRFFVEALVLGQALDVRLLAELRGTLELALLLQNRIDVGLDCCILRHGIPRGMNDRVAPPSRRLSGGRPFDFAQGKLAPAAPATTQNRRIQFGPSRRGRDALGTAGKAYAERSGRDIGATFSAEAQF